MMNGYRMFETTRSSIPTQVAFWRPRWIDFLFLVLKDSDPGLSRQALHSTMRGET